MRNADDGGVCEVDEVTCLATMRAEVGVTESHRLVESGLRVGDLAVVGRESEGVHLDGALEKLFARLVESFTEHRARGETVFAAAIRVPASVTYALLVFATKGV